MQLQKFVGDSMPAVLSTLKDTLGSDAIILANRRVGDHIEIIATGTLDEESIDNAALFEPENNAGSAATSVGDSPVKDEMTEGSAVSPTSEQSVANTESDATTGTDAKQAHAHNMEPCEPARGITEEPELKNDNNDTHGQTITDELSDSIDMQASQDEAAVGDSNRTEPALPPVSQIDEHAMAESIAVQVNNGVESRLEQFHTIMDQRLSQLEVNLWGEKDPVKSKHLQTLLEIGLGAELAVSLVNRVDTSQTYDEALRSSLVDLANTLPIASDRTLTHDGITFVTGPSGAGKTTTLLKLAAQKKAKSDSDSVVIICADAKRTGAFESLSANGNSLGVPVVCARTHQELQDMLSFYANKELVLVDQPLEDDVKNHDIPEVYGFGSSPIDPNGRSVRHLLVLPATVQSSVLESVISEFSNRSTARCVITNLDRPSKVGELFTALIRNNLRVAYWSDCSDIQSPLNQASAQTLVAAAMAMGRRLIPSEDERYLMDLIHPRFTASVVPMLHTSI